jgi:2-polyprenyl-3-methyl-5-hydroxy-6-metoxy-1,4-benzoquinol methylase
VRRLGRAGPEPPRCSVSGPAIWNVADAGATWQVLPGPHNGRQVAVTDEIERPSSTQGSAYTQRLYELEAVWWKRLLDVQRLYRWNLRRWHLGRVLDVGCGVGRNLVGLGPDSVGVDHNPHSIEVARSRGFAAYTVDEFFDGPESRRASFDAMLLAHVIEHMSSRSAHELVARYLPMVRPGGAVLFICPQEKGFASDPTHVRFADLGILQSLAAYFGLAVVRAYSFPLPRIAGRYFTYNEFCVLARVGSK